MDQFDREGFIRAGKIQPKVVFGLSLFPAAAEF
jgi:hypothetical protein